VAQAEYVTQSITLQPGWNAVYFEIEPSLNDCETVFEGVPVKSVWAWNKRFTSVQYVRNPEDLLPEQPEWRTYFPSTSESTFLTDLYSVHAGETYLIDLAGDQPATLNLVGKAVLRKPRWNADSFNLVGFPIDSNSPPTFRSFFDPDPALAGQAIYRLGSDGQWEEVNSPSTDRLQRGTAYWVFCEGGSSYGGPLMLSSATGDAVEFGQQLSEQVLSLTNNDADPKTVTLTLRPPDATTVKSKTGAEKTLAGGVAISYQRLLSWESLQAPLEITIEPKSTLGVRLAVRRADMEPATGPDTRYGSVLEVSDAAGNLQRVAVAANKAANDTGLWVGTAVIDHVSEAGNPEDFTSPTPTSSEFKFRLIVHMDGQGQARLLQQVYVMQVDDEAGGAKASGAGKQVDFQDFVEYEPARYVLVTDDSLLDQFSGVLLRNGEVVGRRISSPVFSFPDPLPLTGNFTTNLALASPIVLDYDDPMNPFVHRFHPDHDNLDERYEDVLPAGKESFTISRTIQLSFSATDPEGLGLPSWGYDIIGGTYEETFSGLHKKPITVVGRFQLSRVSQVEVLNDGL
jgi:hypothetical protein